MVRWRALRPVGGGYLSLVVAPLSSPGSTSDGSRRCHQSRHRLPSGLVPLRVTRSPFPQIDREITASVRLQRCPIGPAHRRLMRLAAAGASVSFPDGGRPRWSLSFRGSAFRVRPDQRFATDVHWQRVAICSIILMAVRTLLVNAMNFTKSPRVPAYRFRKTDAIGRHRRGGPCPTSQIANNAAAMTKPTCKQPS